MKLRDYQTSAIEKVERHWRKDVRSVVLVAPSGSGKTVMGAAIAQHHKTLWVAHRQELVFQAASKLRMLVGDENVGIVMGSHPANSAAPIQVGTVETLIARREHTKTKKPDTELIVWDECHHVEAFTWNKLLTRFQAHGVLTLGLTATPERNDGRGLGDVFEKLVAASSYSELIRLGHLVRPVIIGPSTYLGKDIAQDPLEAWKKFAGNHPTFWFSPSVDAARNARERLHKQGVSAAVIDWETPKGWRETAIESFAKGDIRVLTNAFCLTEGVDVPDAVVGLSTRAFRFAGAYIQAFGRLARATPNKRYSIILDLTGTQHVHGSPVDDWVYSLAKNDEPIQRPKKRLDEADKDFSAPRRGVVLDEELYLLDAGPLHEEEIRKLPVKARGNVVNIERAKRIRARHGHRAAISAIEYESRR